MESKGGAGWERWRNASTEEAGEVTDRDEDGSEDEGGCEDEDGDEKEEQGETNCESGVVTKVENGTNDANEKRRDRHTPLSRM